MYAFALNRFSDFLNQNQSARLKSLWTRLFSERMFA